jgi:hypothetical protein
MLTSPAEVENFCGVVAEWVSDAIANKEQTTASNSFIPASERINT